MEHVEAISKLVATNGLAVIIIIFLIIALAIWYKAIFIPDMTVRKQLQQEREHFELQQKKDNAEMTKKLTEAIDVNSRSYKRQADDIEDMKENIRLMKEDIESLKDQGLGEVALRLEASLEKMMSDVNKILTSLKDCKGGENG